MITATLIKAWFGSDSAIFNLYLLDLSPEIIKHTLALICKKGTLLRSFKSTHLSQMLHEIAFCFPICDNRYHDGFSKIFIFIYPIIRTKKILNIDFKGFETTVETILVLHRVRWWIRKTHWIFIDIVWLIVASHFLRLLDYHDHTKFGIFICEKTHFTLLLLVVPGKY